MSIDVEQRGLSVYLAARYSRREELCAYRTSLEDLGVVVTSRWLDGSHQIDKAGAPIGDDGEELVENGEGHRAEELRVKFAREDLDDVVEAQIFVLFTEQPRTVLTRGGRMVEFGVALARSKTIIVVGPRENLFCWLPLVTHYETWDEALASVTPILKQIGALTRVFSPRGAPGAQA